MDFTLPLGLLVGAVAGLWIGRRTTWLKFFRLSADTAAAWQRVNADTAAAWQKRRGD